MTSEFHWVAAVVDVLVLSVVGAMLAVLLRKGFLVKGEWPRTARVLILLGIGIAGFYYAYDLLALSWSAVSPSASPAGPGRLHAGIRDGTSALSLVLIALGMARAASQRKTLESAIASSRKKMALAERSIVQSESRFRSLFTAIPDSAYCLEFDPPVPVDLPIEEQIRRSHDAILVECNSAFAWALECERPSDAIGMRFGDLDSPKDTATHDVFMRTFIQNNYRLHKFELVYKDPEGQPRALQITWTGILEDRCLTRVWAVEKNILDLRRDKAELINQRLFQRLLSSMSSRLLQTADEDFEHVLPQCLREVCEYIDADRTAIVWFDKERQSLQLMYYWNEHGGAPAVEISMENFPWMANQILSGNRVQIDNVADIDPAAKVDQGFLQQLGLKSLAVVPLSVAGELIGAAIFGKIAEKYEWLERDMFQLTAFAAIFSNVVQRVNSRKSLDNALADLRRAKERLQAENVYLRHEIHASHGFNEIVGESERLLDCLQQVEGVAQTDTAVLLLGETGTGKELVARAIHHRSSRHERPLVRVNCAALPANLVESELFGHEKGAFTGAGNRKRGRFDLADGGTLFLDEIADLPLELQGKLLRVLQEGEFERLGGNRTIRVDVRIIAATNKDLAEAVERGEFRADLYYRINTFPIRLPPLRERHGDIQLLAEHFVDLHARQLNRETPVISAQMLDQLCAYSWPGNVRELENVIQRALISSSGPLLSLAAPLVRSALELRPRVETRGVGESLHNVEAQYIREVLIKSDWVISGASGAAARLGLPPSTLRSRMKKLGIERPP